MCLSNTQVRLAGNVERRFLVFDLGKLEREYEKIS